MSKIAKKDLVSIRPGVESDLSFIYSTFMKSLYFGNTLQKKVDGAPWHPNHAELKIIRRAPFDLFSQIREETFYQNYQKVIERLIRKPGVQVFIACLKEDPDVILGYSIFQPKILHFVFVKDVWRRIGLARDLIPPDIEYLTHLTKVGRSIAPKQWEYNPFLI